MIPVILLHGLARSYLCMKPMAQYLKSDGLSPININYDSRRLTIEQITQQVYNKLKNKLDIHQLNRCYFVGHSLGGIIIRNLAQRYPELPMTRSVLIGSPNQGAKIVDLFPSKNLLSYLLGVPVTQLSENHAFLTELSSPTGEFGVIAGNLPFNPLNPSSYINWYYGNRRHHDGTVEIQNTKLENMKDFICLKSHHTFMMFNPRVMQQTAYFLKHGHFLKPSNHI